MIDIVFCQNEKMLLSKGGQHKIKRNGEKTNQAFCSSAKLFVLDGALNVGDISGSPIGDERAQVYTEIMCIDMQTRLEKRNWSVSSHWNRYVADYTECIERARSGETARIWFTDSPHDWCGLLGFIHDAVGFNSEIHIIQCSGKTEVEKTLYECFEENGVCHTNMLKESILSVRTKNKASCMWRQLREENAPIRAVIDGRLVSSTWALYDAYIIAELLSSQTIEVGQLIVRVLAKYNLNVSDYLIGKRIKDLITEGSIVVTNTSKSFYRCGVKKV